MGFLSGLGATISQKGSEVADKTKKMVETTTLNGNVNDLNKAINKIYQEIGRKYFEANRENAPEAYAEEFGQIEEKMKEIDSLNEQIAALKGGEKKESPVCPSCGQAVEEGAAFCAHCGAKIG